MSPDTTSSTVVEQIDAIANRQLSLDYFEKRTIAGDLDGALRERIERDDRVLLVCYADGEIVEIDAPEALYRTDEILGFAFFGTYTREEMEAYMEVPVNEVFDPDDFPAGHFRNLTLRDDAQGGEIGSRMMSRTIEQLYELAHDVWVVLLRNRADVDTPAYAEDFGAERVAEYQDYFDDRICAYCGQNCECTFAFYRMEVG